MIGSGMSPLVARLLLAFSVIALLASIRAIRNPEFRYKLLRDPKDLKQGHGTTLASAWLSAVWWGMLTVFLILVVFRIHSTRFESLLLPMAVCLLVAWGLATFFEYRRRKRSR